MRFNLKWLIYLPILFFFLPGFSFYMPGLNGLYNFYYISLYFAIIAIFILDRKFLINKFLSVCKNTPLLYFIVFLIFIVIDALILSLFGITSITQTIRSTIMRILLGIMPTIIYFIYIIKRYLGLQNFIKIFMFLFWLNLILSFIAYIGRWFDIGIINNLFDFLNNKRLLGLLHSGTAEQTAETYFIRKRLCGLYEEPGFLGQMIFLFLPFVYTYANSKFKLYNNILYDNIFKKTIIPFSWITLLLAQSAMAIVYAIIITIIYYFKNILFLLKKYFVIIIPILLFTITIIISIDFSDTFIMRIINVITNVRTFEEFIIIEPSLATRVVSYINEFQIFLQHPLTGVGLGNIHNYMFNQYLYSPVPLTPEIITRTKFALQMGGDPMYIDGLVYSILAEHGIFSFILFSYYFVKNFLCINIIYKIYDKNSVQYMVYKSLFYVLIVLFLLSFYDLNMRSQYLHLIITLCALSIYDFKLELKENQLISIQEERINNG